MCTKAHIPCTPSLNWEWFEDKATVTTKLRWVRKTLALLCIPSDIIIMSAKLSQQCNEVHLLGPCILGFRLVTTEFTDVDYKL